MARKHRKPIIAVPAWGEPQVMPDVRDVADVVVGWDAPSLLAAVPRATTATAGPVG
jgi:hypothetical protein